MAGLRALLGRLWLAAIALPLLTCPAPAFELITRDEAKLPPDITRERGITRGPRVVLVSPQAVGLLQSPFHLKIRFEGRGGVPVDPDSVVVTYRTIPAIDLTQRLRRFIRADGLDIDDTIVPQGRHRIHIGVNDADGRVGALDFAINVKE